MNGRNGKNGDGPVLRVHMGEGVVARGPHIILSPGIGSCVALALYDTDERLGGLAHVMLPETAVLAGRGAKRGDGDGAERRPLILSPFQYADTAIITLLEMLRALGAAEQRLMAKLAGGARMFPSYNGGSVGMGEQTAANVRSLLERKGIRLAGWDLGGTHGRTVEFHPGTGRMVVTAQGKEGREL
ncbi:MAG: chemotaxis protein CheD [Nitrospirota bacterium]|nr:chemotaxis protein CheD [Nitrospirota bacterium]